MQQHEKLVSAPEKSSSVVCVIFFFFFFFATVVPSNHTIGLQYRRASGLCVQCGFLVTEPYSRMLYVCAAQKYAIEHIPPCCVFLSDFFCPSQYTRILSKYQGIIMFLFALFSGQLSFSNLASLADGYTLMLLAISCSLAFVVNLTLTMIVGKLSAVT